MNEDQLDELECHLAAGTDIPTALAAVEDEQTEKRPAGFAEMVAGLIGAVVAGWLLLRTNGRGSTGSVSAVRILDKDAADSPQFAPLVRTHADRC